MKNIIYIFILAPFFVFSQVGINTTNPQETLHVEGTLCVSNTTSKTPNKLSGTDANGVLTDVIVGDNLELTGNVLSASENNNHVYYKIAPINIVTPVSNTVLANLNIDVSGANSDKTIFRLEGATNGFSVSGILGGTDGRHILLYNSTTNNMKIDHLDTSSAALNQIDNLGLVTATNGIGTVELVYDGTLNKWIVVNVRS